ncbi:unnamed protein product [Sympodiomycopsis kandeliae]
MLQQSRPSTSLSPSLHTHQQSHPHERHQSQSQSHSQGHSQGHSHRQHRLANGNHRKERARAPGPWPPGAAYRNAPPPPAEFAAPLFPPNLEVRPKTEQHNHPDVNIEPERGVSDSGRLTIDTFRGAAAVAHSLGATDEPTRYYWTFDSDGQPQLTRFNPLKRPQGRSDPEAPHTSLSNPLPFSGNRGFKLKPNTADHQNSHKSQDNNDQSQGKSAPSATLLTHAVDPDDELVTSHAPKWNAFGRLAPWTSGMTGPLTGQGEEEVGPSAFGSAEEGDVGERRPRRGDRETNDRLRIRLAALQRAGVRSLITSSPPPRRAELPAAGQDGYPGKREASPLLPLSPSFSHRGLPHSLPPDSELTTSALAPTLLQPVLSPLDLLQSRTLKHTFQNPHIQALAKTTLDLGESDHKVQKSVGAFWAVLEEDEIKVGLKRKRDQKEGQAEQQSGSTPTNGSKKAPKKEATRTRRDRHRRTAFSPEILGVRGCSTQRSIDELNPTFSRLEEFFITDEDGGLRIPVQADSTHGEGTASVEPEEINVQQTQQQQGQQPVPEAEVDHRRQQQNETNAVAADDRAEAAETQKERENTTSSAGAGEPPATVTEPVQTNEQPHSQERMQADTRLEAHATEDKPPAENPDESSGRRPTSVQDAPSQEQPGVFLSTASQREILLASLSCLHELASDSAEYSDRLQEIRGRLSEVQQKREKVWRALRLWAVKRVEEGLASQDDSEVAADGNDGETSR